MTATYMAKHELKPMNARGIVSDLVKVLHAGDSSLITKRLYDCLYLMSGFIAHFNIGGFAHHYQDLRLLINDILASADAKDPERYVRDAWFTESYGMPYCQAKTNAYKGLRITAEAWQHDIGERFAAQERAADLAMADALRAKHGVS